jgi:hypothetical protein
METASTMSALTLAQVDVFGEDATRLVIMGVLAVVAAAAAWQASRADTLATGAAYWVAGLAVAAVTGFFFYDTTMALFAASIYAVPAAALTVYVFGRSPWEFAIWSVAAGAGLLGILVLADQKTAAFAAATVIIVFTAFKVLDSPRIVHAAIWLAGMLGGVAFIFLGLAAEFLAIIQILIYVGAVVTLFLFTVMLTTPDEDVHFLDELELPPGVTIESVRDLNPADPGVGHGPYKAFQETNPRKPTRAPDDLTGVSIADGVYGDETTVRRKAQKDKEGQ